MVRSEGGGEVEVGMRLNVSITSILAVAVGEGDRRRWREQGKKAWWFGEMGRRVSEHAFIYLDARMRFVIFFTLSQEASSSSAPLALPVTRRLSRRLDVTVCVTAVSHGLVRDPCRASVRWATTALDAPLG